MDKKAFGYPTFDASGVKTLTEYSGPYRDMLMDIRVYRPTSGSRLDFVYPGEEMAVLLQRGRISLSWEGSSRELSRRDVFTGGPWCLHVCAGVSVTVEALSDDAQILVQRTHNSGSFESRLYSEAEAPWVDVAKGMFGDTANRRVNTFFDHATAPYSNMVMGEVMSARGNWSGYIPHSHPQPEVYYFLFEREEGFGASFVGDDVFKITDGSFSAIPGGLTHPQVTAPGYRMYTCWMIRHLDRNPWVARIDDTRYLWLNEARF
ncbi:MAG: 5-deoxy-glucuronate isomerase [Oscillospiraceae bacterium]|nr:5-deoxy-glucuronate isomerase [Oscillospiraceae bacterium]